MVNCCQKPLLKTIFDLSDDLTYSVLPINTTDQGSLSSTANSRRLLYEKWLYFHFQIAMRKHQEQQQCVDDGDGDVEASDRKPSSRGGQLCICEYCDRVFPLIGNLKRHIQREDVVLRHLWQAVHAAEKSQVARTCTRASVRTCAPTAARHSSRQRRGGNTAEATAARRRHRRRRLANSHSTSSTPNSFRNIGLRRLSSRPGWTLFYEQRANRQMLDTVV